MKLSSLFEDDIEKKYLRVALQLQTRIIDDISFGDHLEFKYERKLWQLSGTYTHWLNVYSMNDLVKFKIVLGKDMCNILLNDIDAIIVEVGIFDPLCVDKLIDRIKKSDSILFSLYRQIRSCWFSPKCVPPYKIIVNHPRTDDKHIDVVFELTDKCQLNAKCVTTGYEFDESFDSSEEAINFVYRELYNRDAII